MKLLKVRLVPRHSLPGFSGFHPIFLFLDHLRPWRDEAVWSGHFSEFCLFGLQIVRPSVQFGPLVFVELAALFKSRIAHFTLIRLTSRVDPQVVLDVLQFVKRPLA